MNTVHGKQLIQVAEAAGSTYVTSDAAALICHKRDLDIIEQQLRSTSHPRASVEQLETNDWISDESVEPDIQTQAEQSTQQPQNTLTPNNDNAP